MLLLAVYITPNHWGTMRCGGPTTLWPGGEYSGKTTIILNCFSTADQMETFFGPPPPPPTLFINKNPPTERHRGCFGLYKGQPRIFCGYWISFDLNLLCVSIFYVAWSKTRVYSHPSYINVCKWKVESVVRVLATWKTTLRMGIEPGTLCIFVLHADMPLCTPGQK